MGSLCNMKENGVFHMVFIEFFTVYLMGAFGYGAIELGWRGHTHWTMLILGGICGSGIYWLANYSAYPLWTKVLFSAAGITTLEFSFGLIINVVLGWDVWDYSHQTGNLLGQICPRFSLYWLMLSIPLLWQSTRLRRLFFRE